jgi:hypothetical protein
MNVIEKHGPTSVLFAAGVYFSVRGQVAAAIVTFGIMILYLVSHTTLINPDVRGGDEFIGKKCGSTKDCGPGRKVFCIPKVHPITGKVTSEGTCRAVSSTRCGDGSTCQLPRVPTDLASVTSSHCFSNNCLQNYKYTYTIRTLFSKKSEIFFQGKRKQDGTHPCIAHNKCWYRHLDNYRTRTGHVTWPNGVHLATGFAISSVDQAVYLDRVLKKTGFMHVPSIKSLKTAKDKSVADDPNITWDGSIGTVTFPNGAKSVIAPKGSGTGYLAYRSDKLKVPREMEGKYNVFKPGGSSSGTVPVGPIINEDFSSKPTTQFGNPPLIRYFKTGASGGIFGTPNTSKVFPETTQAADEDVTERHYINFATDPATLKLLSDCDNRGCGLGIPSSLRQSGQLWFFQPTCGKKSKPCSVELR